MTGAAARVGRAVAIELARAGFDLALHYRSQPEAARAVLEEVSALGASAFLVQADLGSREECERLTAEVSARFDALHLLVNNVSVFYPRPFREIDADEWDAVLSVNLKAPFLLSRGLMPLLERADGRAIGAPEGQRSVVIHLIDIGVDRPLSGHAHYSVSKAGLAMLVKAMAVELAPAIRTLGVSPGQVAWPESYDEALRARLTQRIPLRRVGSPEDIAVLVRFLTLQAHYLNGAIVPVDGGLGVRY